MLSFDCHPAHFSRHYHSLNRQPCSFAGANAHFNPQARRHTGGRRFGPRYRDHQQSLIFDPFSLLDVAPQPSKPRIFTKVIEDREAFHIHIKKDDNSNDFRSYLIRYSAAGDFVNAIIESAEDDFQKIYRFNQSAIDIANANWRIVGNVLIVDIPRPRSDFVLRPSVARRGNTSRKSTPSESPKPAQLSKPIEAPKRSFSKTEPQKPRVISIPIEFFDSNGDLVFRRSTAPSPSEVSTRSTTPSSDTESEVSTGSSSKLSRSNSEASSNEEPTPKLTKLTRKVSIEEVEDEAFVQTDLD